jgi:hypothetical protein
MIPDMGDRTIPWCCAGFCDSFKGNFERAEIDGLFRDRRGFFVSCRQEQDGPLFTLTCRAVASENVPKLPVMPVPISLESEMGMRFCPWCGTNLAKHYARHLDLLTEAH